MCVSLVNMLFAVRLLCTGLTRAGQNLAVLEPSFTFPLGFGTKTKLLHHSDISFTSMGVLVC